MKFIRRHARLILVFCYLTVLFCALKFGHILNILPVDGPCMNPTIEDHDIVIMTSLSKPEIGDIVCCKVNGVNFTKRIADIQDGQYWLLGDNLDNSFDSRYFGWVDSSNYIGKVIYIIKN